MVRTNDGKFLSGVICGRYSTGAFPKILLARLLAAFMCRKCMARTSPVIPSGENILTSTVFHLC